ncbi:MAG: hypothetical protein M1828_006137 [Chrysothrix sp. TS-e1954]|nr:MAG: hypothetical protein M1828_006137 [Chrysothrix sp. TS-e1954]
MSSYHPLLAYDSSSDESFNVEPESSWRRLTPRSRWRRLVITVVAASLVISAILYIGLWILYDPKLDPLREPLVPVNDVAAAYTKVVGLIFFGRRSRVSILDCYLKRNLVENGGVLDEVRFIARTDNAEDLEYLDELVRTSKSYTRVNITNSHGKTNKVNYGQVWDLAKKGELYIKLDDDVVFIGNETIPSLIKSKIEHPEHLAISANVINNPALASTHYHLGAIRPYLPDLSPLPAENEKSPSWRASELPPWTGPPDFRLAKHSSTSGPRHRWLPLPSTFGLDGTPIVMTDWRFGGAALNSWSVAAQEHYSFLENLEKGELSRYDLHSWDGHYKRISINMIAVLGDDIVSYRPVPKDDEQWLTVDLSAKTGRHVVIDGKALAVHYAFGPQKGLDTTDLLERYRSYAQEEICQS